MGNPRLLTAYTFGAALIVGFIIALVTNSWWVLAIAVGAHFLVSAFFLWFTLGAIKQEDKPDPVTEAHAEAKDRNGSGTGALTPSGRRGDREVLH